MPKPNSPNSLYISRLLHLLDHADQAAREALPFCDEVGGGRVAAAHGHILWAIQRLADPDGDDRGGEPAPGTRPLTLDCRAAVCTDRDHQPERVSPPGVYPQRYRCRRCDATATVKRHQDPLRAEWNVEWGDAEGGDCHGR